MEDQLFLLAGPAFAVLALLLFFIPGCRPVVLRRAIWILACCMIIPTAGGFVLQSSGLMSIAFLLKPVLAVAGAAIFIGTVILWKTSAARLCNALPAFAMLMASLADATTVQRFANTWGGASC